MKSLLNTCTVHSFLCFALLSASCSKSDVNDSGDTGTGGDAATIDIAAASTLSSAAEGNTGDADDEEDLIENSSFTSTVTIEYGSNITVTNPLAQAGVSVSVTDGDVTVNSTVGEVAYRISGTSTNGSFKLYSEKKYQLILSGVDITNADGPAINIQSKKRGFIVLEANTSNQLADGSSYASSDEDMKGTFFSEGQLIFSGTGSLNIAGNYKHGIVSDDYARVRSGNITITGAVKDGIHTNEAFIADGGNLDITAASDGIDCEEGFIVINDGVFNINAVDDGIAASYDVDETIDPYLTINGGSFNITTSEGEGIESKSTLTINDGNIIVNSYDDGLNAAKAIYLNGGVIYVNATHNDGIDSNGILTITGGITISAGSTSPEEGFDCDNNTFKVTGGIIIGLGGATSSPTAAVTTQPCVIMGGSTAGQLLHIETDDGSAEALTFQIPRSFTTLLFSSPKLRSGKSYIVFTGGSVTGGTLVNGLYTGGTYTKGSLSSTGFTTSTMVTSVGGSTGPGGGGGGGFPGG